MALCAAAPAAAAPEVVIALHKGGEGATVLERLTARDPLALGLLGATQGPYSVRQTLLDMTQGARISKSGYSPGGVPNLKLLEPSTELTSGTIERWDEAVARADSAPADLRPGLLASSVGGMAYVASGTVFSHVEAVLAADQDGRVAEVSIGFDNDIVERLQTVRSRVAVVLLPEAPAGDRILDELIADPPGLLLVIRRPPRSRIAQLLPSGMLVRQAGPGAARSQNPQGLMRSGTTRRTGLVTGIDVLPTVLEHLDIPIPDPVRGRPIFVTGQRDVSALRKLDRRLRVVPRRRYPLLLIAFGAIALACAAIVASGLLRERRGGAAAGGDSGAAVGAATSRSAPAHFQSARRQALRVGGLAVLWLPLTTLLMAALSPERNAEVVWMALLPVSLALLTDHFLDWPKAPALPALGATLVYCVDLVFGSPLIVRSILGPNPRFGARFYGIGNELEAILPVLALVGLAAVLGRRGRPWLFGAVMLALGVFVGAGRLGADVGGVITIGAAGAAAVLVARAVKPTRTVIAIACAVPVLAIGGLAFVDIVSGGDAHFTTTILGADDAGALWDVVERRTSLALDSFLRGLMPVLTILSLALIAVAWRRRATLFAGIRDRPAWWAALAGSVAAGVIGSIANDSGPTLLVFGTAMLAAAVAYLRGEPTVSPDRTTTNPQPATR